MHVDRELGACVSVNKRLLITPNCSGRETEGGWQLTWYRGHVLWEAKLVLCCPRKVPVASRDTSMALAPGLWLTCRKEHELSWWGCSSCALPWQRLTLGCILSHSFFKAQENSCQQSTHFMDMVKTELCINTPTMKISSINTFCFVP